MSFNPGLSLEDLEKAHILSMYRFHAMNKTKTAQALGIAIRTLDAKLAKYEGREIEDQGAKADQGDAGGLRKDREKNNRAAAK